jgi:hypothetical protein
MLTTDPYLEEFLVMLGLTGDLLEELVSVLDGYVASGEAGVELQDGAQDLFVIGNTE